MYKIKECIIVEGMHDKIKLSNFIDGVILVVHGFAIYNNKDMQNTIKRIAEEMGIVILTDSDSAGFRIRSFIKQNINPLYVKHAYIPDIVGKEKRKREASKEGLLGVEGIDEDTIINALKDAGCEIDGKKHTPKEKKNITKADLMRLSLTGTIGSREKRRALLREMELPARLSTNMLLEVLNSLVSIEELENMCNRL